MRIRRAGAADAAALATLYRQRRRWLLARGNRQWRHERFAAPDLRAVIRHSPVLVATLGDQVVGAARLHWHDSVFWPDRVGSDAAYVAGLVVATRVAGRSISGRLIAAAAKLARARRRSRLRLDCAPLPELARLYRRLGFTFVDESGLGGYRVFRFERALSAGP
ncbi:MAG TPA: GNAT family N-acetyltransferase [Vineibacter sp.]|nr:GNAT family N-acetyltransferase [Vineibacter sp.]